MATKLVNFWQTALLSAKNIGKDTKKIACKPIINMFSRH